ncbi:hypothetical protein ACOK4R_35005 (plasmid) [Pseudomonas fluorescens]|uniref:hypothetical protein n=1 Tax=Pseudomonas TaxID=286 RepID=UPI001F13586C|nr:MULTISPECIES: hypothetical protein [Pseudomonas]
MARRKKIYSEQELIEMDIDELDEIAFGYTSDQQISVDPKSLHIYLTDMENAEHKFELWGMKWVKSVDLSEPIQVSVRGDGRLWLEDGHHRAFCARIRGESLQAIIEIKANPVLAILNRQKEAIIALDDSPSP